MNKRRDAWLNPDLDGYLSLFADDFVFYGAASSRLGDGQRSRRLLSTQFELVLIRAMQRCWSAINAGAVSTL